MFPQGQSEVLADGRRIRKLSAGSSAAGLALGQSPAKQSPTLIAVSEAHWLSIYVGDQRVVTVSGILTAGFSHDQLGNCRADRSEALLQSMA